MGSPEIIYVCNWLVRDTFRQALANRVFWFMLAMSAVVIFFCLSIGIEGGESLQAPGEVGIDRPHGKLTLGFGAWRLPLPRDGQDMVHFILTMLGERAFGIVGILFSLILTAGIVPEFLQPNNAMVLLTKPTPRWVLLAGKCLGVVALLAFQVGVFVIGTFLAVGVRTGFWVPGYLLGIPILLLHFTAVYSFSVYLAVLTRRTVVCIIGSVVFWFLCWGLNFGRDMVVAQESSIPEQNGLFRGMIEIGYWILPKPVDLAIMLDKALGAQGGFDSIPDLAKAQELGAIQPELVMLSCLAFPVCMIVLSARQLAVTEY